MRERKTGNPFCDEFSEIFSTVFFLLRKSNNPFSHSGERESGEILIEENGTNGIK